MNVRASRLLTLYGLFVLITGAFGYFAQGDEASRAVYVTLGLGVVLLVMGTALRNAAGSTAGVAFGLLLLTIANCAVNSVRGWLAHAEGSSELFLWSAMLSMAFLFGLALVRPVQRAWKRAQQFDRIVDSDNS